MENKLPLYQLGINLEDESGIDMISLVKFPAIESNFKIAFAKEEIKFSLDKENRIVTGLLAIPGKEIMRNGYKVMMTEESIRQDLIKFFKRNALRNVNVEHKNIVDGCFVCSAYLTGKIDKCHELFGEVPKGSLCLSMFIENDGVLQQINAGELLGFSLEGSYEHIPVVELSIDEIKLQKIKDLLKNI